MIMPRVFSLLDDENEIFSALLSNPPPIIEHGHANQTLTLHSSAILPCQAIGQTTPRISWLKNGHPLEVNAADSAAVSRIAQLTTGSLQISDLTYGISSPRRCRRVLVTFDDSLGKAIRVFTRVRRRMPTEKRAGPPR